MTKSQVKAPASLDNIKPLLKRLLDLRMDKRDIEKEIKELDEQVRPIIAERGKMQLDNYVFECKLVAGRKSIDKTALTEFLEKHGKSMADFEKEGAPFTQMNVTEVATVL